MFSKFGRTPVLATIEKYDLKRQRRGPRVARLVVGTTFAFLAGSLYLSATTTVPEIARAGGQIQPVGRIHQADSIEGGRVIELHAREGQFVTEGELLAVLQSPSLIAERATLVQDLEATTTSLKEHLDLKSTLETGRQYEGEFIGVSPMGQRLTILQKKQGAQFDRIVQLEENLRLLENGETLSQQQVQFLTELVLSQEQLLERRLTTQSQIAPVKERLIQAQATSLEYKLRIDGLRQEIAATRAVISELELSLLEELLDRVLVLQQEQDALSTRLEALDRRVLGLEIRSPTDGFVQAVAFPNPGQVIAPGETLFEIMPIDFGLVVEIEIGPRDIGHIKVGDSVSVSVDTFDPRRYGRVAGTIDSISPNSIKDPQSGLEHFRAIVELENQFIGAGVWERPLRSGMNSTAEIVTQQRALLSYLMKPIDRAISGSFNER